MSSATLPTSRGRAGWVAPFFNETSFWGAKQQLRSKREWRQSIVGSDAGQGVP
jgi:hypothetical protein